MLGIGGCELLTRRRIPRISEKLIRRIDLCTILGTRPGTGWLGRGEPSRIELSNTLVVLSKNLGRISKNNFVRE